MVCLPLPATTDCRGCADEARWIEAINQVDCGDQSDVCFWG